MHKKAAWMEKCPSAGIMVPSGCSWLVHWMVLCLHSDTFFSAPFPFRVSLNSQDIHFRRMGTFYDTLGWVLLISQHSYKYWKISKWYQTKYETMATRSSVPWLIAWRSMINKYYLYNKETQTPALNGCWKYNTSDPAWSGKELPQNSGSLSLISISGGWLSHSPGLSHSVTTLMPLFWSRAPWRMC